MCDHPGCAQGGEYRAPRGRDQLNSYFWFCLEHVRAYNAAWDYYAGMTADEIEAELRRDMTWQRPTWPLGRMGTSARVRIDPDTIHIHDPFGLFGEDGEDARPRRRAPLSPEEEAMRVLELMPPVTLPALKSRYRELVKLHHPDANPGDASAAERFKTINQAYKTLLDSLNA